jgi:signal transduction histidine kinase
MKPRLQNIIHISQLLLALLLLCAVLPVPASAQPQLIDSLRQRFQSARSDTARVNALNDLSDYYWSVDTEQAIAYARQAVELATRFEYRAGEAKGYNNLGSAYWFRAEYEQSLVFHNKALALRQALGDRKGVGSSYNNIGGTYHYKGDYGKALQYYLQSLAISDSLNDEAAVAVSYNNIGEVYRLQGDFTKALEYQQKGLNIREKVGDKRGIVYSYTNIGEILRRQNDPDGALSYFQRGRALAAAIDLKQVQAEIEANIGAVYEQQGKLDMALATYRSAADLQRIAGDKPGLASTYVRLGSTFCSLNQLDSSRYYLQRALDMSTISGSREIEFSALTEFIRYDSARGNVGESFARFRQATILHDSLFGAQRAKQIAELQSRYDNEKREQQLQSLQKEQSYQSTIRNTLIGAMLLMLLTVVVVVVAYRQSRQQNTALQAANDQVSRQMEISEKQSRDIQLKNGELYQANLEYEFSIEQVNKLNETLIAQNSDLEELNAETMRQQEVLERQTVEIELNNNMLEEKNAQLEYLNAEKNEFLGIAAHDLKNPLSSVIMSSSTIRRYYDKMTQADIINTASNIEETAQMMNQIIMNLLDTNAIESGKMRVASDDFDLGDLVGDIVGKYSTRSADKHITMNFERTMGVCVHADESMTQQVLDNLVSNAVKYSPKGKNIWVSVVGDAATVKDYQRSAGQPLLDDRVLVVVRDEGPGLSADDKKKLFGKFARLSARPTGGEHSTGLGLSIVKRLAEAMHGAVWCESELGHGATFVLQMPATKLDAHDNTSAEAAL